MPDPLAPYMPLPDGPSALIGTGAPHPGIGINGDHYVDADAELLLGPKAMGRWPRAGTLISQDLSASVRALVALRKAMAQ
jgi:hypothetical protein